MQQEGSRLIEPYSMRSISMRTMRSSMECACHYDYLPWIESDGPQSILDLQWKWILARNEEEEKRSSRIVKRIDFWGSN